MEQQIKPLTPREVASSQEKYIHPKMVETVNELLVKHYSTGTILIPQEDIVSLFLTKVDQDGWTREKVYKDKQLNFEALFREYGWGVRYDKPGFNETGEAYFEFTPKTKENE